MICKCDVIVFFMTLGTMFAIVCMIMKCMDVNYFLLLKRIIANNKLHWHGKYKLC